MKFILAILCFLPVLARAEPTVLVDAVPSGAAFFNSGDVQIPIHDLDKMDDKEVEANLSSLISKTVGYATQNGVTYICLLSATGENTKSFRIKQANARLNLQTKDPSFSIVLYRQGSDMPHQPTYSLERPDSHRNSVTVHLKKIALPEGWTPAMWFYFNLPRIQAAASKAGATEVFLQASGTGSASPVIVPGLKNPLMLFSGDTTLSASWYRENVKEASYSVEHDANKNTDELLPQPASPQ